MRSLLFLFLLVVALKTDHINCEYFNRTIFKVINAYRKAFNVPPFTESYELSKGAMAYAQHLATLNIKDQRLYEDTKTPLGILTVDHMDYPPSDPNNKDYTENICEFMLVEYEQPIEYWTLQGRKAYKRKIKERTKVEQSLADKYTALYWKSSTKAGIGMAPKNKNNVTERWIMVMRFTPPGNKPGEYAENVSAGQTLLEIIEGESSGGRQGSVLWIYIVLSIQIYLLFNWETQVSN